MARQSTVLGGHEDFAVVFAAMGITFEEAYFFMEDFRKTGAIERTVMFVNLADDPAIERITTPGLPSPALNTWPLKEITRSGHPDGPTNYCEALRRSPRLERKSPAGGVTPATYIRTRRRCTRGREG